MLQMAQIVMLKNDIHHCKTSGIFLRLGAGGLIADNDIHSNCEAGIDIRKGANPLILVLILKLAAELDSAKQVVGFPTP
ncbi:UNVERIFIED_CONTAM: hypothetical protein K2H54_028376 [Gekko kuhli]